jgi:hypothetical protein
MSDTTKPDMQLLSKADVIREYGYPKHQLNADIEAGAIAHFRSDEWGRYYIPRKAVEDRITALSAIKGKVSR